MDLVTYVFRIKEEEVQHDSSDNKMELQSIQDQHFVETPSSMWS